jgi:hypothetical protein
MLSATGGFTEADTHLDSLVERRTKIIDLIASTDYYEQTSERG